MSRASQSFVANTNNFNTSFVTAGILLIGGTVLTYFINDHKAEQEKEAKEDEKQEISIPLKA